MAASRGRAREDDLNPYVALSDVGIVTVLVVVFIMTLGNSGVGRSSKADVQRAFADAVAELPKEEQPTWRKVSRDPAGVQRWVFDGRNLFERDGQSPAAIALTDAGRTQLAGFGALLKRNEGQWQRIQVEGHSQPTLPGVAEDWSSSAQRAALVTELLQTSGGIPPWKLKVSTRAGQNPAFKAVLARGGPWPSFNALKQELVASGVVFSEGGAAIASQIAPEARPPALPYVVVLENGEFSYFVSEGDEAAMLRLRTSFPRNERVEVVVEW